MELNEDFNIHKEVFLQKLKKQLLEKFIEYNKYLTLMQGDVSISALCLKKSIEKKLIANDILRVYEIFNLDLTKVKWLSDTEVRHITASLNKFLSMS